MLVEGDNLGGVLDEVVGELADVDEPLGVDTYVDEGSEVGDVGDDAGQELADAKVGGLMDGRVELEGVQRFARVEAWFVELLQDVLQGGQANGFMRVCAFGDVVGEARREFLAK